MRRVRYRVVSSLDGFIAGPNGEIDWITMDPEVDFGAIFSQFDTALIGRKTYETMVQAGNTSLPGIKILVFSTTLREQDHPGVTIVREKPEKTIADLRANPGKDIWLFGGGALFSSLAGAGLVDTVEVGLMPVLLGAGVPLAPNLSKPLKLKLTGQKIYKTGIVSLDYAIQ